jgi:DNA-directed RNA polymerase, mitochondrial
MEERQQEAARNRAAITRAKLRAQQRESVTEYGRALVQQHGEPVALALEHVIGQAINGQVVAGPYHAGMWLLFQMGEKGPRAMAAIALQTVIDRISQRISHRAMALAIGSAIEAEIRALPVEDRGQDLLRIARRRHGKALARLEHLRALRIDAQPWSRADRFQVGAFLLAIVIEQTDLVRTTTTISRRGLQLEPTEQLAQIIADNPPRPAPARRLPMLSPPRPWRGMTGGGHLTNAQPLVRSRQGHPLEYLTDDALAPALLAVNTLQEQQLEIDPWMVDHQRVAWDAGIRGLFPVTSRPPDPPPMPAELVGPEAMGRWRQQVDQAHRDRREGSRARAAIEASMRQAEQLAGQPIWFSWCMDMRGRLYTANRATTHQGPDHEKAQVLVANAKPCDDRAADWILKAAAIHWGLKGSWGDRLQFGRDQIDRMLAAAEDPLERVGLWRDAKEPWQFLSMCRALQQWIEDPSQPIRQLVRLDQTTSGPGIIGALLRDGAIARACNMTGSTRHDLYQQVADEVALLLRSDLEAGDLKEQRLAGVWLKRGVSRAMAKLPVMSTVYGAGWLGVSEQLVAVLDQEDGPVNLGVLERDRLVPCRYLARKFGLAVGARMAGAVALQKWLREACRRCVKKGVPMRWTTPMGMPIQLGKEMASTSKVRTLLHGTRRWQTVLDAPTPGELSSRETVRSVTANVIHSFDAALVWQLVCDGADHGATVLPNHDCFGVAPYAAEWLHTTLHQRIGQLYRTDWLAEIKAEIEAAATGLKLPALPMVGTLEPSEIGENPYLFS